MTILARAVRLVVLPCLLQAKIRLGRRCVWMCRAC